ncbi:deaminase [Mycolicibacter sinensis]|uniref:deaminase n=1 Tax=Mycolicibacter sinensis (strain JDM601) TaxID=875328 RepID=UPI000B1268BE|nr:deaminase [Mycolicibacter sinensis]
MAGDNALRPEIVIGLVGALGTNLARVEEALADALLSVGYTHRTVRVSDKILSFYEELNLPALQESATPIDHLMDLGDELRRHHDDGGVAAAIAVSAISKQRYDELGDAAADGAERDSVASIVRQLKHPDEVRLLRSVYGPRFVLLGAWSPKAEREDSTNRRLRSLVPSEEDGWYDQHVSLLMNRDEKDGSEELGQRVRDTFELADAYVALRAGHQIREEIGRIVRLLFGAPFETPTRDEQAMFQASGARMRSSAGGRQVGAVAVDDCGELLASGTNEVPKAGGGQYWEGDKPDHRDFRRGADFNDQEKLLVVADLLDRLKTAGDWLTPEMNGLQSRKLAERALANDGPFRQSRVTDLLEFGRILHAEMALICTAARRGTPLDGATMYSTTYPCHQCARLIIGSGIDRVVYIDPYPKSLVPRMYGEEVSDGTETNGKVAFVAFAGVAPRLFPNVFAMVGRKRDPVTGEYLPWVPKLAQPRLVSAAVLRYPIQVAEDVVINKLAARFDEGGESREENSP